MLILGCLQGILFTIYNIYYLKYLMAAAFSLIFVMFFCATLTVWYYKETRHGKSN